MTTDAELLQAVAKALCSHWSSEHEEPNDFDVRGADRAIAATRASGRLAPEGAGDVVEAALNAVCEWRAWDPTEIVSITRDALRETLNVAAPLIAAAAEAKAREECAKMIEPKEPRPCDYESCDCMNVGDAEAVAAWDERKANAAAIRTGSAS